MCAVPTSGTVAAAVQTGALYTAWQRWELVETAAPKTLQSALTCLRPSLHWFYYHRRCRPPTALPFGLVCLACSDHSSTTRGCLLLALQGWAPRQWRRTLTFESNCTCTGSCANCGMLAARPCTLRAFRGGRIRVVTLSHGSMADPTAAFALAFFVSAQARQLRRSVLIHSAHLNPVTRSSALAYVFLCLLLQVTALLTPLRNRI